MHRILPSTTASPAGPVRVPDVRTWQTILAEAIRDPAELCRRLDLPAAWASDAAGPDGQFRTLVPEPYLARIRPGDPNDPLLAQVLPRKEESDAVQGFLADPLGETKFASGPGLLQKYKGRLLIVASGVCGVHCRFCFRRHFPYIDALSGRKWEETTAQIAADPTLDEVILSGGDPLTLSDARLVSVTHQIAAIPHVRRLRVHTRMPIVIPQRVDSALIEWLRATRLTPIVVLHVNHPAEIDAEVAGAFGRLVDAGVPLLSQSVLLRGVNDDAHVLEELFRRLVDLRVMPYYLHQLDRVAGAAHFEVPASRGMHLIGEVRRRLPGYAVPRYVHDTPGADNKQVIA